MLCVLAAACLTALVSASGTSADQGEPEIAVYRVQSEESEIIIEVGRAGLLQMFGHDHTIQAGRFEGRVEWSPGDPSASRFRLEIDAASLVVADDDVSDEDRAKIQADMESKALAVAEHDAIVFESTRVAVDRASADDGHRLEVRGTLTLRGVARDIDIPLVARVSEDRFRAEGSIELPSDEWGVPQISVAGGTVKTEEELDIDFTIVAVRE